jgi:hypothetical protein
VIAADKPMSGPRHLAVPVPSPVIKQDDKAYTLEFYTQQQVAACELAAHREKSLAITDSASLATANAMVVELAKAEKEIDARADALTAQHKQTIKAITGMRDELQNLLNPAKRSLQGKLITFKREQDAKKAEADRLAKEEARKAQEAAEAERKRLQAEADAKHAEAVAAAKAKADAEAKELAEVLGEPVEAAPVVVAPAPVIETPTPVLPAPIVAPVEPVEVAVTTRKERRPEVYDLRALCRYIADGGAIDLIEGRLPAIKNALVGGAQLPGCRLIEVEVMANKRSQP